MVLLIIDTQKLITTPSLYGFEQFKKNVKMLIESARKYEIEVIYVRHDDGEGEVLTRGNEGFEIFEDFTPLGNEKIFDKTVNSAFRGTGLVEYLRSKEETEVIVAGLQTDYCIDATVKCGFEHGFKMIVPAYANTTVNNAFMSGEESYRYHNEHMWPRRYAICPSVSETIEQMKSTVK